MFSAFRSVSKRGGSLGSRRESFAIPDGNNAPLSPADFTFRGSHTGEDDFQFNGGLTLLHPEFGELNRPHSVPDEPGVPEESQQSGVLTLEKNSFNFLEYVHTHVCDVIAADAGPPKIRQDAIECLPLQALRTRLLRRCASCNEHASCCRCCILSLLR